MERRPADDDHHHAVGRDPHRLDAHRHVPKRADGARWDLAKATGHTPSCDQALASAALDAAHTMLRPEYRDMMGVGNPFGAERPTADGATTLERFAAFMGRPNDWRP